MTRSFLAAALAVLPALPLAAQESEIAAADVENRDGTSIGTVTVTSQPSGHALVILALTDIPEGDHAVHLHETGDCSAEDFSSAGGHIAGDAQHGIGVEGGPHPGDLPNVVVGDDGVVNVAFFNPLIEMSQLFDEDGAAFIMHSDGDDYVSQPAGAAGDRIACGVFRREAQ
ncbi:superoxide dismutase family protein [Marivita sp. GX14005]|uniref:superoxide dismutase family protein n=1 Tax=Marivita sp. GX14005 TaxID=2942276 RepID=UPI002019F00F|nr:superoxide dismutase family protein [Marivita sp. GX14005]MCL3881087.1 superoxide dismutase family protein [Marivita sp. GX14005]